jgi:E3 ubiquitin-protein ligase RAD18
MKEWQIFNHLDTHAGESETEPSRKACTVAPGTTSTFPLYTQPPKPPERLPALNYSILKDQTLRKKMTELGISASGPRLLLERRHREWVTIWNANCDATRPRKRFELINDLENWERTQRNRPDNVRGPHPPVLVKDKDFDTSAWASKHETSYKDLIAQARKSRLQARQRTESSQVASTIAVQEAAAVKDGSPPLEPEVIPDSNTEDDEPPSKHDNSEKPHGINEELSNNEDVMIA